MDMPVVSGATDVTALLGMGVYALLYRGEVVYIGKSKEMLRRINAHRGLYRSFRRYGKNVLPPNTKASPVLFDAVEIIPCHPDRVDELEQALIKFYHPKHNIVFKSTSISYIVDTILSEIPPTPPTRLFKCRPLA
jgi:hypothetical protein